MTWRSCEKTPLRQYSCYPCYPYEFHYGSKNCTRNTMQDRSTPWVRCQSVVGHPNARCNVHCLAYVWRWGRNQRTLKSPIWHRDHVQNLHTDSNHLILVGPRQVQSLSKKVRVQRWNTPERLNTFSNLVPWHHLFSGRKPGGNPYGFREHANTVSFCILPAAPRRRSSGIELQYKLTSESEVKSEIACHHDLHCTLSLRLAK